MKNLILSALVLMLLFSAVSCSPGPYVSAQVGMGYYPRPPRPYANYIWVGGDYYRRGGRYVYHPGYWAPPRVGYNYHPGGWINSPHGNYWRRGGWVR